MVSAGRHSTITTCTATGSRERIRAQQVDKMELLMQYTQHAGMEKKDKGLDSKKWESAALAGRPEKGRRGWVHSERKLRDL